MRSSVLLSALIVATSARDLGANGRPPEIVSIHFRSGHADIVMGATFGVVLSRDGGSSWQEQIADPAITECGI